MASNHPKYKPPRQYIASAMWMCLLLGLLAPGCSEGMGGWDFGNWGNAGRTDGQEWTIMCAEFAGPRRRANAEETASVLSRTKDVRASDVQLDHGPERSRINYGRYMRYPHRRTGKLSAPSKMVKDLKLIRDLAGPEGGRFFFDARLTPAPTPDVGNPDWHLRNNRGAYTLRVAIFFREGEMTEPKVYAAKYCEELREKGYDAYYRHGDFTSEVYVGSFGEDAQVVGRKSGVVVYTPSVEVQRLQRKENFLYELWNMKVWGSQTEVGRARRASRLVRVDEEVGRSGEFDFQ